MKLLKMKFYSTVVLFLLCTIFVNCNETKKVMEQVGSSKIMGIYTITELNGMSVSKDMGMSFEISEINKSIRGTTGCNSFFGTINIEGNNFHISEMNISENYCDEVVMKSEQSLISAFNTAVSYRLNNKNLTLYSDTDDSAILNAVKNNGIE